MQRLWNRREKNCFTGYRYTFGSARYLLLLIFNAEYFSNTIINTYLADHCLRSKSYNELLIGQLITCTPTVCRFLYPTQEIGRIWWHNSLGKNDCLQITSISQFSPSNLFQQSPWTKSSVILFSLPTGRDKFGSISESYLRPENLIINLPWDCLHF